MSAKTKDMVSWCPIIQKIDSEVLLAVQVWYQYFATRDLLSARHASVYVLKLLVKPLIHTQKQFQHIH